MGKRYIKVYDGDENSILIENTFVASLDKLFKEDNYPVSIEYFKLRKSKKMLYPVESEEAKDEFDVENDKAIIFWNLYWTYRTEEQKAELTKQIKAWIDAGAKIHIVGYCSSPDLWARSHLKSLKDNFGEDNVEKYYSDFMVWDYFGLGVAEKAYKRYEEFFDNKLAFDGDSESNKPAKLAMKPNQS